MREYTCEYICECIRAYATSRYHIVLFCRGLVFPTAMLEGRFGGLVAVLQGTRNFSGKRNGMDFAQSRGGCTPRWTIYHGGLRMFQNITVGENQPQPYHAGTILEYPGAPPAGSKKGLLAWRWAKQDPYKPPQNSTI